MNFLFLNNMMRSAWEQHVWWTRMVIIGILKDMKDLPYSTARLLRNPKDIANIFRPTFGNMIADRIAYLFEQHLVIAAELVNAVKNNEVTKINDANKRWFANADDIANYFSTVSPYYNRQELQQMLYEHLNLTKEEAATYLKGEFENNIKVFDRIEAQALMMATFLFKE
jgi:hypothetical protein